MKKLPTKQLDKLISELPKNAIFRTTDDSYPLIEEGAIIGTIYSTASAYDLEGNRIGENLDYKIINDEYAVLV